MIFARKLVLSFIPNTLKLSIGMQRGGILGNLLVRKLLLSLLFAIPAPVVWGLLVSSLTDSLKFVVSGEEVGYVGFLGTGTGIAGVYSDRGGFSSLW